MSAAGAVGPLGKAPAQHRSTYSTCHRAHKTGLFFHIKTACLEDQAVPVSFCKAPALILWPTKVWLVGQFGWFVMHRMNEFQTWWTGPTKNPPHHFLVLLQIERQIQEFLIGSLGFGRGFCFTQHHSRYLEFGHLLGNLTHWIILMDNLLAK